jgi:hypothetical protein
MGMCHELTGSEVNVSVQSMSATDRCQCTGCVDCLAFAEAPDKLQDHCHCRRLIVHFIDNRCDECHEEEVDEMYTATGQAIHKQYSTDESGEPPL